MLQLTEVADDTSRSGVARKSRKVHYAFVICLGGFLTQFIVLSCQRLPAISLEAIRATLGVGYAEVGLITSWFMLFYAGLSLFWGWLSDRIGTRKSLTIAVLIAALGTILFGLFAQYGLVVSIVLWSLTGFGCAGLLMAIIPKLIAKWFVPEKRGFGMALVTPGANIASIVLGIVVPIIIANSGWQMSYVYFGIAFAVIALIVAACIKDSPESMRVAPYGVPKGTQAAPRPKIADENVKHDGEGRGVLSRVIRMPLTWRFGIMFILWEFGYMAATQYYVSSIQYAGFTLTQAGYGLSFAGLATVICIQIWGNLSDKVERKNIIAASSFACALFGLIYFFALKGSPSLVTCWVLVSLITACTGAVSVIMVAAGDCYPAEIRGTGTGFLSTLSIIGRYLGPWVAGIIVDVTVGQVGYAYLIVGIMMLLAGVAAITLPKVRNTQNALS